VVSYVRNVVSGDHYLLMRAVDDIMAKWYIQHVSIILMASLIKDTGVLVPVGGRGF
jgi:hypothetical protein